MLKNEFSDVFSSQGNMSNAASNDEPIRDREHVSDSIAWVNDCAGQVGLPNGFILRFRTTELSVKSKSCLHTNEKSLYIESLKHNLCHLLSVLGGVHGRLCQDKSVLLWFTSQLGIDGAMPEFLHGFPVLNLTTADYILHIVGFLMS
jgi:hypothetical protein